ncbi:MAG TPA: bifunctional diaminohydroxyphosphoribosylaminopyrimidine deaminase/5-amino-6-(5-phosphoribosylamino)uracil reductase RibD [Clostridia bacterium]|nr:bifunctional diaminohydroxyphosphoribosylaminopyrimidine deaminase/5-amino-6-(5-phosphoribosylamino)uracil reductase RibD [Clostridia bacterium]
MAEHSQYMRRALRLARRGYGRTSPNPIVGAVLVKRGRVIGNGWHHEAGAPHAEIEAIRNAQQRGHSAKGATLYVTLEPCCTTGRTPPCTRAIVESGISEVVVGATDPNPSHCGRGFAALAEAGVKVATDVLRAECAAINETFRHWIVHRTPFVTIKAAMTLDGKIATASGQSKWITGDRAREHGMHLRQGADAILVGINTILSDDPSLTLRPPGSSGGKPRGLRRIVLDAMARIPAQARVVSDSDAKQTTVVVSEFAPKERVARLARQVKVVEAPSAEGYLDLKWLLRKLGEQEVTSLLVEGGGEVNASFLLQRLAQRVAFFYAPIILGGAKSRRGVGGAGIEGQEQILPLRNVVWRRLGPDWLMTAEVEQGS